MQQHIKSYYDKIEAVIASRVKSKKPTKPRKGLLSPSGAAPSAAKEQSQIEMIADMVQGIRDAKEEILNARK
jgi:hypothetical protein